MSLSQICLIGDGDSGVLRDTQEFRVMRRQRWYWACVGRVMQTGHVVVYRDLPDHLTACPHGDVQPLVRAFCAWLRGQGRGPRHFARVELGAGASQRLL